MTGQDPDGSANIDLLNLALASGPTATPACVVTYKRSESKFYLGNNSGSEIGLAGVDIENANCKLKVNGTSATAASPLLTLAVSIELKGALTGQRNLYTFVQDTTGVNSGWYQWGTWNVPAPPSISVTAWAYQTSVRMNDFFPINATVTGTSSTGVTWSDGGRSGFFQNPSANATQYGVPFITPSTPITLRATSTADPTKWGTVTLTFANNAPEVISVSPTGGQGTGPYTFTYRFRDVNGTSDLATLDMFMWKDGAYGGGGCQITYEPGTGSVTLHGAGGGVTYFGGPALNGSHCYLDAAASSATPSGNEVSVALRVTFKSAFWENFYWSDVNLRGRAVDAYGASSGLQSLGVWYVP